MPPIKKSSRAKALLAGYKSGLEDSIFNQMKEQNVEIEYEPFKIPYKIPASSHKYTPDFVLANGVIVETKGRFVPTDRKKHLLVKEQYPELDIRFVFSNSKSKLRKGSPTSYADWCNKYGFKFADKWIPGEWVEEPVVKSSLSTIKVLKAS
jgi:hypothetical protein